MLSRPSLWSKWHTFNALIIASDNQEVNSPKLYNETHVIFSSHTHNTVISHNRLYPWTNCLLKNMGKSPLPRTWDLGLFLEAKGLITQAWRNPSPPTSKCSTIKKISLLQKHFRCIYKHTQNFVLEVIEKYHDSVKIIEIFMFCTNEKY